MIVFLSLKKNFLKLTLENELKQLSTSIYISAYLFFQVNVKHVPSTTAG